MNLHQPFLLHPIPSFLRRSLPIHLPDTDHHLMLSYLRLPRRGFIHTILHFFSVRFYSAKMPRILCVAEKPSIAKAVAEHLSGGRVQTVGFYNVSSYIFDISLLTCTVEQYPRQVYQKLCFHLRFRSSLGTIFGDHDRREGTSHAARLPPGVQKVGLPTTRSPLQRACPDQLPKCMSRHCQQVFGTTSMGFQC